MKLQSLKGGKFEAKSVSDNVQKAIMGGSYTEPTIPKENPYFGSDSNTYYCCDGLYDKSYKLDGGKAEISYSSTIFPGTKPEWY